MLSSASLPFSSSDSGHQKWKLRCWNSSSKPRRLDLRHLCLSPLWVAPRRPSSRSSFPLLVLLQPQLRLLLFREENAAIAAVDAIVDQQLWLSAKRGQWLTRPPWQCYHHHRRSSLSSPAPSLSATCFWEAESDDRGEARCANLPHPQCGRPSPTNTTTTTITNTTITCSTLTTCPIFTTYTIDTIATTTYTAPILTTTRRPPGLAQRADAGLRGGGTPISLL